MAASEDEMSNEAAVLYRVIAEAAAENAPDGWVLLRVEAKLFDGYDSAGFFYKNSRGEEHKYDPGFDGFEAVMKSFVKLRDVMACAGKPTWKTARFELDASGKFHIDFGYDEPAAIFGESLN